MGTIDKVWEEIHSTGSWGEYPPEHVIRFVARNYYMSERKNVRILDFGCGQGANTWFLAREGFDTYAFDGSESAVIKARRKIANENLKCHFSVMDGTTIDYNENFFDAVIDNACIYSNKYSDIMEMYKKILYVLKPGGKLLTVCFGEDLEGYKTGEMVENGTYIDIKNGLLSHRGIAHIFTEDELYNLIETTGFQNVQVDWVRYSDNGNMVHQYICTAEKKYE